MKDFQKSKSISSNKYYQLIQDQMITLSEIKNAYVDYSQNEAIRAFA